MKVVVELLPYSGGLKRNIVQCLDDFNIPLKLSHTVVDIDGKDRVKGVTIAQVDQDRKPIPGTEQYYACDTLLLSCGLIPENELSQELGVAIHPATSGPRVDESFQTSVEGVFACGNVLHVHDLVDFVSKEAKAAGRHAALFVRDGAGRKKCREVPILAENGVRYTVPCSIHPEQMEDAQTVRFRVGDVYRNCFICVYLDENCISRKKRLVAVPGEMEEVILQKKDLQAVLGLSQITVRIEEA